MHLESVASCKASLQMKGGQKKKKKRRLRGENRVRKNTVRKGRGRKEGRGWQKS